MSDPVNVLIKHLSSRQPTKSGDTFIDKISDVLVVDESARMLSHFRDMASGTFSIEHAEQLSTLIKWCSRLAAPVTWELVIIEPFLSRLPEALRKKTVDVLLDTFAADGKPFVGTAQFVATSLFKIVENQSLLQVALGASLSGIKVGILATESPHAEPPFKLTLSTSEGGIVITAGGPDDRFGGKWSAAAWSGNQSKDGRRDSGAYEETWRVSASKVPTANAEARRATDVEHRRELSVAELFEDLICLRDLQPRAARVRGLDVLRAPLKIASPFVPRKNEPDYARVVRSFVHDVVGRDARMIYVGDTIFNDGSVICNLDAQQPGAIFGFLCNERSLANHDEYSLGPIYFSNRWRSLVHFAQQCVAHGICFDQNTVALFDLDQTVYAAKGRDDAALHQARWEAIQSFLGDTIPSYKYDAQRAERIYRQFDRDEYHRVTRDNMDYVVLLVLAVAAGLCDAKEIEAFSASAENSISSLTELLFARALARRNYEDIESVLEVIRAVHYNTLAGDQTPCKDFRRYECISTAAKMRGAGGEDGRIYLNREVVEFVSFLKQRNVHVFAVSDRPVEAAVDEEGDGVKTDLMTIPMRMRGFSIIDSLKRVD